IPCSGKFEPANPTFTNWPSSVSDAINLEMYFTYTGSIIDYQRYSWIHIEYCGDCLRTFSQYDTGGGAGLSYTRGHYNIKPINYPKPNESYSLCIPSPLPNNE